MTTKQPAYKEVWFWVVFSPLILVVFVCAALIKFAVVGADSTVSDEYYKEGRMINNRFASEQNAERLSISAVAELDKSAQEIRLEVFGEELPEQVTLTLSHPADEELDRTLVLARVTPHQYRAPISPLPQGRYYLVLEADAMTGSHWRLSSEINFSQTASAQFGIDGKPVLNLLN